MSLAVFSTSWLIRPTNSFSVIAMPSFTVFKGNKQGKPQKATTERPDKLEGDQVIVRVTASGLCGTDIHYKTQDMALGHEGAGVVEAVGPKVSELKVGDRVGWGYQHGSCGQCEQCLTGWETFCAKRQMYGYANLDQGSFATKGVWNESFLFKIPDGISDTDAAPLQCGGATVFNALQGVVPGEVVGIMGVGGLGHLAIQFASKMGCRVVVLSSSDRKKEEATKLGAHEFVATKDVDELKVSYPINRLLVTASAQPNWAQIIPILAPRAKIFPLSVDSGDFKIPYMPLILSGFTVQGSLVAARAVHRRMLDFAALHHISPVTEIFQMTEEGVNEAIDRLEKGDITYRAVLVNN
ncbi:chaperonin 10-like protein [Kockovaella imperatae]|uniref:Chaperonin 10-like protein n=1 Tax=Kockovaella imperatae TaxID=4999 RepID=A0A1Y1UDV4_9TREE|nr:chaperonin 10-like protein [Kockovaella imperatae]ORX36213.1 chaperonin 10-like protein [Kockovaella imperatae]